MAVVAQKSVCGLQYHRSRDCINNSSLLEKRWVNELQKHLNPMVSYHSLCVSTLVQSMQAGSSSSGAKVHLWAAISQITHLHQL